MMARYTLRAFHLHRKNGGLTEAVFPVPDGYYTDRAVEWWRARHQSVGLCYDPRFADITQVEVLPGKVVMDEEGRYVLQEDGQP